jgi:hypothetical protein
MMAPRMTIGDFDAHARGMHRPVFLQLSGSTLSGRPMQSPPPKHLWKVRKVGPVPGLVWMVQ